ncbi:MAG: hypothetical protein HYV27_07145 [Candidatus Hydrogenedentes bacterium]|nr:hypothetical protein [Candidatus Hydrogenedentota bacterium]
MFTASLNLPVHTTRTHALFWRTWHEYPLRSILAINAYHLFMLFLYGMDRSQVQPALDFGVLMTVQMSILAVGAGTSKQLDADLVKPLGHTWRVLTIAGSRTLLFGGLGLLAILAATLPDMTRFGAAVLTICAFNLAVAANGMGQALNDRRWRGGAALLIVVSLVALTHAQPGLLPGTPAKATFLLLMIIAVGISNRLIVWPRSWSAPLRPGTSKQAFKYASHALRWSVGFGAFDQWLAPLFLLLVLGMDLACAAMPSLNGVFGGSGVQHVALWALPLILYVEAHRRQRLLAPRNFLLPVSTPFLLNLQIRTYFRAIAVLSGYVLVLALEKSHLPLPNPALAGNTPAIAAYETGLVLSMLVLGILHGHAARFTGEDFGVPAIWSVVMVQAWLLDAPLSLSGFAAWLTIPIFSVLLWVRIAELRRMRVPLAATLVQAALVALLLALTLASLRWMLPGGSPFISFAIALPAMILPLFTLPIVVEDARHTE